MKMKNKTKSLLRLHGQELEQSKLKGSCFKKPWCLGGRHLHSILFDKILRYKT